MSSIKVNVLASLLLLFSCSNDSTQPSADRATTESTENANKKTDSVTSNESSPGNYSTENAYSSTKPNLAVIKQESNSAPSVPEAEFASHPSESTEIAETNLLTSELEENNADELDETKEEEQALVEAAPATTGELLDDKDLAVADISSQANETMHSLDSLSDDGESADGANVEALGLAEGDGSSDMPDVNQEMECKALDNITPEDTNAPSEFQTQVSISKDKEIKIKGREFHETNNQTEIWSRASASIPCNKEGTNVDILPKDLQGVKKAVEYSRKTSSSISFVPFPLKMIRVAREFLNSTGSKTIEWNLIEPNQETLTVNQTVSFSSKTVSTKPSKDKGMKKIESAIRTAEDNPLKIIFVRKEILKPLKISVVLKKTITSGKTISTYKDGGHSDLTYDHVSWEKDKGCRPVEGTITGEIFAAKDAKEPILKFKSDFSKQSGAANFSNGFVKDLDFSHCPFEKSKTLIRGRMGSLINKIKRKVDNINDDDKESHIKPNFLDKIKVKVKDIKTESLKKMEQ